MSVTAVQFYGVDDVVEAYNNKGTPAFAIWCGKMLQFRYDGTEGEDEQPSKPNMQEGEQLLRQYLSSIWALSTATYTLKTYDDLSPGQKIRPSTEYDTAFNFKICLPQSSNIAQINGAYPSNNPVLNELKKLNERMDRYEELSEQEVDEEPQSLQEAVIGLLQEPERLSQVVEPIKELVSLGRVLMGLPPIETTFPMQSAMNGLPVKKIGNTPDPDKVMRLGKALDTLEQYDDLLVEHLEKLAQVASSDKVKFKGLLSMLDLL